MGGTPIPEPGDEQRYTAGSRGLLVLPRARPHDSGRYLCIATNSAGSSRLEITLLVSSPLSARVSPALLTAALGQSARFSCTIAGHPVVSIFWFKDGQPLSGPMVQPGAEILRLSSVTRDDQGMYQCFVKNENDSAQGTAELRLGGKYSKPVFPNNGHEAFLVLVVIYIFTGFQLSDNVKIKI
jgi:Immunoglobulin I-set domain.